jgi:tripartite-type tricarboxylate transporter receptor subunit TctC
VMIRYVSILFLLLVSITMPVASLAQSDKTVRLVVGLTAGGAHDVAARAIAERLRDILGQPVVVENKPGAGQRLALNEVKRSAPDGRTLLIASNSPFTIFPHTFRKLDYDPVKDFTPITRLMVTETALGVGPKVPVHDMKEFTSWARANPKQATFGTPGAGTLPHFIGIMLGKSIGVDLVHIPYKGGAPAMIDFTGGHLPIVLNALSDMLEGHRSGKFRIIATAGMRRSPLAPEVPTLKESGVDIVGQGGVWIYGPAGMPADVVKRMNGALLKVAAIPEFRERFAKYAMTVAATSPEELARIQADETRQWEEPIRASGFKEDE